MKRNYWLLLAIGLVTFFLSAALGQRQSQTSFDPQAIERELEVMKGIIRTHLSFLDEAKDLKNAPIEAYYLPNQGAVFVLPVSSGRHPFELKFGEWNFDELASHMDKAVSEALKNSELQEMELKLIEQQIRQAERAAAQAARAAVEFYAAAGKPAPPAYVPVVPPAPEPPEAPEPPGPRPEPRPFAKGQLVSPEKKQELEERMTELKEKLQRSKEQLEEKEKRYQEFMNRLEERLIEVLSKYGDSLTQLKENENLNVVLTERSRFAMAWGHEGSESKPRILTARRSDVLAYKTGNLTFDQFRSRVIRY